MSLRLLVLPTLLLTACATTQATQTPASDDPVVATYSGKTLRMSQVEERAGDELRELREKQHEMRIEAAERIAIEELVVEAAKKAGQSEEAWLEAQLEKNLPTPSEEELKALYEKLKPRMEEGTEFEAVKSQLTEFSQREAKTTRARALFADLKKQAGFTLVLEGPKKPRKTVEALGPSKGNAAAPVTIVAFADFQCPYCAKAAEVVDNVVASYGDKVRLVFRHFPLSFHPKAPKAAEGAACADEQGQFWAFHDVLFSDINALDPEALKAHALNLKLDTRKFDECLDSGRMKALVARDMKAGSEVGVRGTPAFFVNGLMLSGAQPEDEFRKLIDAELAGVK